VEVEMAKSSSRKKKGGHTAASGSRVTASKRGRYTAPLEGGRVTPKNDPRVTSSPQWYGPTILGLMLVGTLMVTMNYLQILPGSASPWYLVAGLGLIFGGITLATKYR